VEPRRDHFRTLSGLCSSEARGIIGSRLSGKPSCDKLDLDSSRKAEVIRNVVDRVCEVLGLGSERALSSTVWQNAQSHEGWQLQVHGSFRLKQQMLSSHPRHFWHPMID
ncbi:hypothetical protein H4R22_004566, partial [Coemansia sp. RSA 1290]